MDSNDREYSNKDITVYWKPKECIHATICYTKLRAVFDPRKRPWINLNAGTTAEIIDIVKRCPTDALTFKYNDDNQNEVEVKSFAEEELQPVQIRLMKDGPIVIDGDFKLINQDGSELKSMKMVSICRCGGSGNMPYCDGTHRKRAYESNDFNKE